MEDPGELDRMKLGQLRGWISANGGKVAGLLEKGEFIAKAKQMWGELNSKGEL